MLAATKTIARHYAKRRRARLHRRTRAWSAPACPRVASAATGGEAAVTATLAMGEWVPPGEVADLIAWLATGTCRHLTGATLDVNGASYICVSRQSSSTAARRSR